MTSEEPALIPQSPFDFAHGPEPVEGREKGHRMTTEEHRIPASELF